MVLASLHLNSCLEDIYGHLNKKIFMLTTALHDTYSTGFFTSITALMSGLTLKFSPAAANLPLWHSLNITPLILVTFSLITLCLLIWTTEPSSPGFINPSSPLQSMDFPLHKFLFRSFNSFLAHLGIQPRVREESVSAKVFSTGKRQLIKTNFSLQ